MVERSHLSIGEVLSLLREEFPDVTISKIRFLESQGLVDPERTPSGYRKFYDHDVERLRWILRQQRENFLPLKIIRGRLTEQGEDLEDTEPVDGQPGSPRLRDGRGGVGGSRQRGNGAGRRSGGDHRGGRRQPSVGRGWPARPHRIFSRGRRRRPGSGRSGRGRRRRSPPRASGLCGDGCDHWDHRIDRVGRLSGPGGRSASPQATGRPASAAPGASSGRRRRPR